MDSTTTALIRTLAAVDAVFYPFRLGGSRVIDGAAGAAVFERQHRYKAKGVTVPTGGTPAERKGSERLFHRIASEGLIRIHRDDNRRRGVSLTDRGGVVARSLTAGNQIHESWHWLAAIAGLKGNASCGIKGRGCVLETDLLDITYGDSSGNLALPRLESEMLPLLAAGLVCSSSDCHAHLGYGLTAAGRKALELPAPESPPDLPAFSDEAGTLYDVFFDELMVERQSWTCIKQNTIWIPLSAGMWPEQEQRADSRDVTPPTTEVPGNA